MPSSPLYCFATNRQQPSTIPDNQQPPTTTGHTTFQWYHSQCQYLHQLGSRCYTQTMMTATMIRIYSDIQLLLPPLQQVVPGILAVLSCIVTPLCILLPQKLDVRCNDIQ